jgi:hypothetical protein
MRTLNALATFAHDQRIQVQLSNGDYIDATRNPQAFVDILLRANLDSLRARYPQETVFKHPHYMVFRRAPAADLVPVLVLKTAQYFNHQACEVSDYEETDAATIARLIIAKAVRALPGYDSAPYGLEGDTPDAITMQAPQPAPGKASSGDLMALIFRDGPVSLDAMDAPRSTPPAAARQTPTPTPRPQPAPKPTPRPRPPVDDDEQPEPY